MQSTCKTCDAKLPLSQSGRYIGNCDNCCEIYFRRDATEKREQIKTSLTALINKTFFVFGGLGVSLLCWEQFVEDVNGRGFGNAVHLMTMLFLLIPLGTLLYVVRKLPTLKEVSEIASELREADLNAG